MGATEYVKVGLVRMPTVSVIIPIYNAENYLGLCINSVVNQIYNDLEIILVNDGSTDGSLAICQNYEELDPRIRVLNIPNGGVSNARNKGLDAANGDFIQFVDSDDTIEAEMIRDLVNAMIGYNADIVLCGITMFQTNENGDLSKTVLTSEQFGEECVYDHDGFMRFFPKILWISSTLEGPCNRMYRRDLMEMHQIRFPPDMTYGEDFMMNLTYYNLCQTVVTLRRSYYNYMWRNMESLSQRCINHLLEIEIVLLHRVLNMLYLSPHYLRNEPIPCFDEYCSMQVIRGIKVFLNPKCSLDEYQIKRAVYFAISDPMVRLAFENAHFENESYYSLRQCVFNYDVLGTLQCVKTLMIGQEGERGSPINPGLVNQMSRKLIRVLKRVVKTKPKYYRKLDELENYLYRNGLKLTLKRILSTDR